VFLSHLALALAFSECEIPDDVLIAGSLESALQELNSEEYSEALETIFIIGGATIYEEAIRMPACQSIHLTGIHHDYECDTFFPDVCKYGFAKSDTILETHVEDGVAYDMRLLIRDPRHL
jgi:dihydrofolate reductase